jgi:DNA repair ATPase RecN
MSTMDTDTAALLIDLIEKVGLLRREMQQKKDFEKYEARFNRIQQKFDGLATRLAHTDPDLAKELRTAWVQPARSLAFRNARHQKELKQRAESEAPTPPDDTPRLRSSEEA